MLWGLPSFPLKAINYWRWWRQCTQVTSCIFHFTLQRIGYLAATQSFHEGLDVVMLTTNMIRKDISTHNQYDASLALNGLACFMTPDLARWALIGTTRKCKTLWGRTIHAWALPEATSNWRVYSRGQNTVYVPFLYYGRSTVRTVVKKRCEIFTTEA